MHGTMCDNLPPCVSTTSLRRCVTRQQRWTKANKTNHATIHRRNRRKCMWQMYTHKPAHHYKYKGQCKTKNKICMMVCVLNSKNMRATPHSNFEVVDELRKKQVGTRHIWRFLSKLKIRTIIYWKHCLKLSWRTQKITILICLVTKNTRLIM